MHSWASSNVDVGVTSDGLITIVLPAANAGSSFHASRTSGVFHGVVIAPHTPIGSLTVYVKKFGAVACVVCPCSVLARPA